MFETYTFSEKNNQQYKCGKAFKDPQELFSEQNDQPILEIIKRDYDNIQ